MITVLVEASAMAAMDTSLVVIQWKWIQSRAIYPLLNFLHPFRPTKSSD